MSDTPIFLITPTTQQYDWGKIGRSSKVAQFASAARLPGFVLHDETPYAEVSNSSPIARNMLIRFKVMDGYTCDIALSRLVDG
jgi:hypothetical protein